MTRSWQPISTAPKDTNGHDVLMWVGMHPLVPGEGVDTTRFEGGYVVLDAIPHGYDCESARVTHWMPLPDPPTTETPAAAETRP